MTTVRRPLTLCGVAFLIAVIWSVLVWVTGIGARLYLLPGQPIAEVLRPCEPPSQPFVPKHAQTFDQAFGEFIAEAMVRCLPQGILAFELSAVFWLVIVPLAVFVGVWLRRRSYA